MRADSHKIRTGSFYTTMTNWYNKVVLEFFADLEYDSICDPYCGDGNLLLQFKDITRKQYLKTYGFDIKDSEKTRASLDHFEINNSLDSIPKIDNCLYITNPPWLNVVISRKMKMDTKDIEKYFDEEPDLYMVAINRLFELGVPFIGLFPYNLLTSNHHLKEHFGKIILLSESPFSDTGALTCVGLYRPDQSPSLEVWQDDKVNYGFYRDIKAAVAVPDYSINIKFNAKSGPILFRSVDMLEKDKRAEFFVYDEFMQARKNKPIRNSRLTCIIDLDLDGIDLHTFVKTLNKNLETYRSTPDELLNTSFLEKTKYGTYRKMIGLKVARALIEKTFHELHGQK